MALETRLVSYFSLPPRRVGCLTGRGHTPLFGLWMGCLDG